jgi:hypothetical protein
MGWLLLTSFILWTQASIWLTHQPPRRYSGDQADQKAAFCFGEPPLAASTRSISQAVETVRVEGSESLAHRLGMAMELSGDGRGTQALPTEGNHLGSADPVAGSMATAGQFTHLAFLSGILRWAGKEKLGHTSSFSGSVLCLPILHHY